MMTKQMETLRRFQILVFDFTATGSASLELMNERALRALEGGSLDEARNLWSRLVSLSFKIADGGTATEDRSSEISPPFGWRPATTIARCLQPSPRNRVWLCRTSTTVSRALA